jgi:hypothetical protein
MHLISKLACLMNWHRPNRRKVRWNGHHFSGQCQQCGRMIVRESHRKWRFERQAADTD